MKNNLFRKFLAVFLTGTMLTGVGCKDYDDDIDDLKGQIDDLKGKIELKADASALQTITEKLQGVDFTAFVTNAKLSTELSGYVKESQLAGKIEAYGYQTKAQVEALINAKPHLTEADVTKLINAQFTAANIWSKIQGDVSSLISTELGKYKLSASQKSEAVAAVLAAIQDDKDAAGVRDAISSMVGSQFAGYMTTYIANNEKTWINSVGTAAAKAIDENAATLKEAVLSLITANAQLTNDKTVAYLNTTDLQAKFEAYDKAIAALQGDVNALINRIQSLVNVPEKVNGTTSMAAYKVGSTEVGNCIAVLNYRVTPAKLAEEIVALYADKKAVFTMVSEKVTRAAEPDAAAAEITGVSLAGEGKIAVSIAADKKTMDELEAAGKSIALALSIQNKVNPGTGAEGEEVSQVENNVLSDFAGIDYYPSAKTMSFKLFDTQETPAAFDFTEPIEKPFNTTVAESSVTLLDKTQLMASFDGESFMTLDEAGELLGASLTAGKYAVTPKYYDATGAEVTGKTNIDKFIIKVTTPSKPAYDSALAVASFRSAAKKENVGSKVDFKHIITMYVDNKATTQTVEGDQTYTITNQKGATLSFGALEPKQWSYAFVSKGLAEGTTTPAFDTNEFGELALTLTGTLPEGVTVQDIIDEANLTSKTIKVEGKDDNSADFKFSSFVSQIAKGVKVSAEKDKYAWGTDKKVRTYEIRYVYTHENIDYTLTGSITFGMIPAAVDYKIAPVTIGYEDKTITDSWKNAYADWNRSGFFKDYGEFTAAIFEGATPVLETKYFKTADSKTGTTVDPGKGTTMTVAAGTLKGELKAADIMENGNKFVQTASWTTWYGQKINVTMTYHVAIPDFALSYNTGYVSNTDGVKTTEVKGLVKETSNLWEWPNITLDSYFNPAVDPDKYDFTFKVASENDKPNKGDKYAVVKDGKLDWSDANRDYVDIKAVVKIKGTNIQVASLPLRVKIQIPIKTLAQTKPTEVVYKTNEATTANLFENLQLIDANNTSWIEYNKDTERWEAVKVGGDKTAYDVFQATPATAKETAGIVFSMKSAKYADGSDASAHISTDKNELIYKNNSAVLLQDITIKITPSFTYKYGKVKGEEMTITIKH